MRALGPSSSASLAIGDTIEAGSLPAAAGCRAQRCYRFGKDARMRTASRTTLLGLLLAALAASGTAWADHPAGLYGAGAGPINFISAGTLEQGDCSAGVRVEYLGMDRFSDQELDDFHHAGIHTDSIDFSFGTFMGVAYGVTDYATVFVRLPHAYQDDIRHPSHGVNPVENEGNTSGLSDILFLSTIKIWESEERDVQFSLIVGLEIPSGRTNDRTREGEVFELEHQPGSGSWDPLTGLAFSRSWDRLSFHANGTYWWVTDGRQDTDLGDIAGYNAALVYNVFGHDHDHDHASHSHEQGHYEGHEDNVAPPHEHDHDHDDIHLMSYHPTPHAGGHSVGSCGGSGCCCRRHRHCSLNAVLELNGTWQEKHVTGDEVDDNSGGHLLLLSPGLLLGIGEHWSVYSSVGFPIVQELSGANHEMDIRINLGTSVGF
jgi:hypothetical protein